MKSLLSNLKINKFAALGFKLVSAVAIISFLFVNLFFSQKISPLYFQIAKDDKTAVASFLNKIKDLQVFDSYFNINKNIYGASLEFDVFAEDSKRKQLIAEYELLLQKNPKSRDLLFSLYLLYKAGGDFNTADSYLKQAKTVDPTLK